MRKYFVPLHTRLFNNQQGNDPSSHFPPSRGVTPYSAQGKGPTSPRGFQGGVLEIKFDELVAIVFRDVGPILLEIYKVYFSHEVKGQQGGMLADLMWKMNEK